MKVRQNEGRYADTGQDKKRYIFFVLLFVLFEKKSKYGDKSG